MIMMDDSSVNFNNTLLARSQIARQQTRPLYHQRSSGGSATRAVVAEANKIASLIVPSHWSFAWKTCA